MKKILGLDLGTNSIGAALLNLPESIDDFGKEGNIEWVGSRIIPIDAQYLNKWEAGAQAETKAAARRIKRGARRLKQRYVLRRARLIKIFKVLGWLDESFPEDFKKLDGNFKFRISDFLPFEESTIKEATKFLGIENRKGVLAFSEDWIIYYLRKKALTEPISIPELARITYMMNQRRGVKSSRKDLKEDGVTEIKKAFELTIKDIQLKNDDKNNRGKLTFIITPDSDTVEPWEEVMFKKPEWIGKKDKYVVTWRNNKQLKPQRATSDDWEVVVVALDNEMGEKKEKPGEYFFNELVKNKNYKIRQFPVYRWRYKNELEEIWKKQIELSADLKELNSDKVVLNHLATVLYPTQVKANKPKLNEIIASDLLHLISNDIIYYQRELKSQKSSVGECQYEKLKGKDGEIYGVKCAPRSCPEFQEFRIWQDIHNIKILQRNGVINGFEKVDIDVTTKFIDDTAKERLFELFDSSREMSQENILKELNRYNPDFKLNERTYRINLFFDSDKKLPGNETKELFRRIFRKRFVSEEHGEAFDFITEGEKLLNDPEALKKLWHILYSISSSDEKLSEKGITTALEKFLLPAEVIKAFTKLPEIKRQYASYSSKAIKKLLPLMRCGKFWSYDGMPTQVKERIARIISDGWDFEANKKTGELIKERHFEKQEEFQALPVWLACYVAYNRHSERSNSKKYESLKEFNIMERLPNNSLRNPIVEQVIRETLFVVKDVWEKYGRPDEIHIELARDLKKNAKEREKATKNASNNFEEKQRIKKLLYQLMNDEFEQYVHIEQSPNDEIGIQKTKFEINPNPESPLDIDKFRVWKNLSGLLDVDFERKIKEEKIPKQQELKKYALWLSQKCISPYTGKIIPLSKLFDSTQYEIEHILPQKLIKNDSFDNLVISEWGVNKAKDRQLGAVFMKDQNGGCEYQGKKYKLLGYPEYVAHCKTTFRGKKLQNLLASEIPEDFISRQINDTRYITRKISELLYPIAGGKKDAMEGEERGGIVFTIGSITSDLKREWGLNKEWKKLIKPRFERLEENGETYILTNKHDSNDIDFNVKENEKLDIKRIDHRHHALDAIIIAVTTIEHIRYLNSLSAADTDEEIKRLKRVLVKSKIREFQLPWPSFTEDTRKKLEETIVTFKTYNQAIVRPRNRYTKWEEKNGKWEKVEKDQEPNKKWMSIRKSLFKEPQGVVYIKELVRKPFRTPNEILNIIELQLKRMEAQNTPAQKRTSYIYDQDTREIVKGLLRSFDGDLGAIKKYLKKNILRDLNGDQIYNVRIAVFKEYAGKRVELNKDFDHKKINKIPYSEKSRIPQALHNHLLEYERKKLNDNYYDWETGDKLSKEKEKLIKEAQIDAFSDEGLEELEKRAGIKIRKVTIKEEIGLKIQLNNKLMEADGNAYFLMYENDITKERSEFSSLSAYDVIVRTNENNPIAEFREGYKAIILQTHDFIYVPTKDEQIQLKQGRQATELIDWSDKKKILARTYIVNDFSGSDIYFKPNSFAKAIKSKELHTSYDDKCSRLIVQRKVDHEGKVITEEEVLIKKVGIKFRTNRLGNILPA